MNGMTSLLHDAIAEQKRLAPKNKVVVVSHDWGCMYSSWVQERYPSLIDGAVMMDVGPGAMGEVDDQFISQLNKMLRIYQGYILIAWFLQLFPIIGAFINGLFKWRKLGIEQPAGKKHVVNPAAGYPYLYLQFLPRLEHFCQRWLGRGYRGFPEWARNFKMANHPKVPTLFMYGAKKPFNFHTDEYVARLNAHSGSECHAVQAGHWIMLEAKDEVCGHMDQFLRKQYK
eukprot:c4824_g1_i1.p1 GENE.c4824_g1_i1~~c4824_g1_i1.p1  ORF type:complete len:228 (-),score=37.48 c4824_g1_i1:131-814(-)